jgi:hypothetical protein
MGSKDRFKPVLDSKGVKVVKRGEGKNRSKGERKVIS